MIAKVYFWEIENESDLEYAVSFLAECDANDIKVIESDYNEETAIISANFDEKARDKYLEDTECSDSLALTQWAEKENGK